MENRINLDLMGFIEQNILPKYAEFDRAHNIQHVMGVIHRSLAIATKIGADINMVYAIAAYHDLGLSGPRAIHHVTGGKILAQDVRLRKWFSPNQIQIMREAVEDHRASASHAPRNLYGKIVAEADRDLELDSVFRRTVQYGIANYPNMNRQQQWERFREHMRNKYADNGYIKLWIQGSPNESKLKEIRNIISDAAKLQASFNKIYEEECAKG